MIQEIITYLILFVTFGYVIYKFVSVFLKYYYAKKIERNLKVPILSVLKYLIVSLILAPLLYLIPQLTTDMRLYQQIIAITPPMIFYFILYLVVSAIVDEEPRLIIRRTLMEIQKYASQLVRSV